MSIFSRLFRDRDQRDELVSLYRAIVGAARNPAWYRDGGVPDTLDGRFDMIAALLSVVLLRLDVDGEKAPGEAALLTELFVDDMDGQLRQMGIGDIVVGKHIGRMMSAVGGRLGVYREALLGDGELEAALVRNLYRGEAPDSEALAFTAARLRGIHRDLGAMPLAAVLAGKLAA